MPTITEVLPGPFIVGEAPFWEEKTQTLLFVDASGREVHRWNYNTGVDSKVKLGEYNICSLYKKESH